MTEIVWCSKCIYRNKCSQDIIYNGVVYHLDFCSKGEKA